MINLGTAIRWVRLAASQVLGPASSSHILQPSEAWRACQILQGHGSVCVTGAFCLVFLWSSSVWFSKSTLQGKLVPSSHRAKTVSSCVVPTSVHLPVSLLDSDVSYGKMLLWFKSPMCACSFGSQIQMRRLPFCHHTAWSWHSRHLWPGCWEPNLSPL